MHRAILRIALPSIISNITVPLLGLIDLGILGRTGSGIAIGALAVGGTILNMVYWLFGFLRPGTGGLTAQAYGANREKETLAILYRSCLLAGIIATAIIIGGEWLAMALLHIIAASRDVSAEALHYYSILKWGAPAVLAIYSLSGWFLGRQNAKIPMIVAIAQNILNISASLILVQVMDSAVEAVAAGTLIAQYSGLFLSLLLLRKRFLYGKRIGVQWHEVRNKGDLSQFLRVNRDIFLRTLFLIAVSMSFTAMGAQLGTTTLAANALLMQFFILFSYIMDGFAYAGEAIGGRFYGAGKRHYFVLLSRGLFIWGIGLAALFTAIYAISGNALLHLLTTNEEVRDFATQHLLYVCLIPPIAVTAFLMDGIYIGTSDTRSLLFSMVIATASYFALLTTLPLTVDLMWIAFLIYLGLRGIIQLIVFPRRIEKFFNEEPCRKGIS